MRSRALLRVGVLAGLAGGAAEIAWIAGYSAYAGASASGVARGVTAALFPSLADRPGAVAIGIALHMLLAVGLGILVAAAFSAPVLQRIGGLPRGTLVVATLGLVWAFNFLVVLPVLDPSFLALLPVAVTLTSKLLFGVGAAVAMRAQRLR